MIWQVKVYLLPIAPLQIKTYFCREGRKEREEKPF